MILKTLTREKRDETKALFLDVFSNEPWFDKWDEGQLACYIGELTDNSNSLSLVLYDENGKIVGGSLGYVFSWWEGREYFIKEFFISRDKQNQGIGSIFLEEIYKYLKVEGIKAITLATEKNFPAYSFYEKNGFKELKDNVMLVKIINQRE